MIGKKNNRLVNLYSKVRDSLFEEVTVKPRPEGWLEVGRQKVDETTFQLKN